MIPMSLAAALPRARQRRAPRPPSAGMGTVAIIGILVMMAALAAAVLRFSLQSSQASQQDTEGVRAEAAARAGIDYGLFQAFRGGWGNCSAQSQTLDLSTDLGMRVTVSCNTQSFNEGESSPGTPRVVVVYTIDAVACNAAVCPDASAAGRAGYVERMRRVQADNR